MKLGAAALLALGLLGGGEEEEYYEPQGYSSHGHRAKRNAPISTTVDAVFELAQSVDAYGCGKKLVCEIQAKNPAELQDDERLLVSLFS